MQVIDSGRILLFLYLLAGVAGMAGCSAHSDAELAWNEESGYQWAELTNSRSKQVGFQKLSSSRTRVTFRNEVRQSLKDENRHYLNGSGVAVGDFDNDGWQDIYFARIDGPNTLYRNLGGYRFEDVTEEAGVALVGMNSTGAVFADIDGDGYLDLLVTSLSDGNTLFLNDGKGGFIENSESGLGESRGSYTMALADLNGNGLLDLYIVNYKKETVRDTHSAAELTEEKTVHLVDGKLEVRPEFEGIFKIIETAEGPYRNEIAEPDELYLNLGNGRFEKADPAVTFFDEEGQPAGLSGDWGLTATFRDINGDGHPDLYVANDFWTPDRFWINQGDGTFRKIDREAIRNISFSSMGVDVSDINRDGYPDLVVTEMLSSLHSRRLRQFSDYMPEVDGRTMHNRNSVYLNRGDAGETGDPTFAQIAYYSGLEASEWSWATSFLDIDLDGYEDLVIATGYDNDYQDMDTQVSLYDADRSMNRSDEDITGYPPLKIPNKIFKNNVDLTFTDMSAEWGFTEEDISMGMALADLNNNGTLDVIVNRMDEEAAIYRNVTEKPRIAVTLKGMSPNTGAIGATIVLSGGPVIQSKELFAGGTYLSGSQPIAIFAASADSLHQIKVTWPDQSVTIIEGVPANRIYKIDQEASATRPEGSDGTRKLRHESKLFEDVSNRLGHRHYENEYDDFRFAPLLPARLSRSGPGIGWLDINQDGREELIVTTGKDGKAALFNYQPDGRFLLFDEGSIDRRADGDQTAVAGWQENDSVRLVLGSANYEQGTPAAASAFVYTLQNGTVTDRQEIPGILSTTGPVAAADYTGDGYVDLFIGGRHLPGQYPADATSRLFVGREGEFLPDEKNSELFREIGLVTDALFADITGNGWQDLLLATEWGSLKLFENRKGTFFNITDEVGLAGYHGWWTGLAIGDFTGNGRADIVALNIGSNSAYQLRHGRPLRLYFDDFNWNGRLDVLETYYSREVGGYVPRRKLHDFESLRGAITHVQSHQQFASSSITEIFDRPFNRVPYKEINTLEHTLFLNREDGFEAKPLPAEAQFSMGFYAGTADFDNDGREDLFISQNFFGFSTNTPRLDGGIGLILRGDGEGTFRAVPAAKSGIKVFGEQRGAALGDFDGDGTTDIVVSQNGGTTKVYQSRVSRKGLRIRLHGPPSNQNGVGSSLRLIYEDGSRGPRRYVQAAGGYASQNSFIQVLGSEEGKKVSAVEVVWFTGEKISYPIDSDIPEHTLTLGEE